MNKPELLIGFVMYQNIDYPFRFDEKTFSLQLSPPTKDIWEESSGLKHFLLTLNQPPQRHEWVQKKKIEGVTSEGKKVIFFAPDAPQKNNGFITFLVECYFIYLKYLDTEKLEGFRFVGHDVNLFYSPQIALESKLTLHEDQRHVKQITVSSTEQSSESFGKYRISKDVDVDINVTAYATYHSDTASPISANSSVNALFSVPVGINILLDAYSNFINFFKYIAYRQNIDIGDMEVFIFNKNGLREYSGVLVYQNKLERENHKNTKESIIPYRLLTLHSAKILTAIKNNQLTFEHLCISINDRKHYSTSRIIMILVKFEREYRNIFGQDHGRSDEYISVKNEIISFIKTFTESQHGKMRQYAKQIEKYVENRDSSFESNIKESLLDSEEILSPFIGNRYDNSFSDTVEGISSRMGELRNAIAHGRLDFHYDAIHLSDILTIEELLYAMRLKKIGLTADECKKAINELFLENINI